MGYEREYAAKRRTPEEIAAQIGPGWSCCTDIAASVPLALIAALSVLMPNAIVTTSKNDVDRIVTEYGIAELRGRTLSQRAKALISIAHPDHRDRLTFEAKKRNILI